jgi:hypothetical protein
MELEDLRKMRDSMQQAATSFESSVKGELNKTESELNQSVQALVQDKPAEAKAEEVKAEETRPAEAQPRETKSG